jgi:hypothetical protein
MKPEKLLKEAFDIHVHCAPDVVPRAQDMIQLSRSAAEVGMSGMLMKDHNTSTIGRVYTMNKLSPSSFRFYSSLVLNDSVGGLNPIALESALRSGTDMVFFPTYSARGHAETIEPGCQPSNFLRPNSQRKGISILDANGRLKAVCETILKLIAHYNAVLATGHISPKESLALLRAAHKNSVQRMVVTHASWHLTSMSLEQQREAVSYGAFIEHCFYAVTESCSKALLLEDVKEQIRELGIEHVILSSDFGQVENGPVVEGFLYYLTKMVDLGFNPEELRVMILENPRYLLAERVRPEQVD